MKDQERSSPLWHFSRGSQPPKQEEVAAAERAPIWQKEPKENSLDSVSGANASEIDRSAMRAAVGQHELAAALF
jgi:hypothetical protein